MVEHCNKNYIEQQHIFDGLTRQMIRQYHQNLFELRTQIR